MLTSPPTMRLFVATGATDIRKSFGFWGLVALTVGVVRENEIQRRKIAELLRRAYGLGGETTGRRSAQMLPDDPPESLRKLDAKERRKLPADLLR